MIKSRLLLASVVLLVSLAAATLATSCEFQLTGSGGQDGAADLQGLPPEFEQLAEVWELLEREHFDREHLDREALTQGAIRGMLRELNDPYAWYLDAEQFAVDSQDIQGYFEGIGAEVTVRDGQLSIIAPLPDTPAERAGIRPGDLVLEINGESTEGLSIIEAVNKIRGKKGTTVDMVVLHQDSVEPVSVTITRDVIPLDSVRFLMLSGGVGHLRISSFTGTTNEDVREALDRFQRSGGVGLVLDLRNNPGGLVSSVVDVASQFLEDGLVMYQVDAQGNRTDYRVKSGGKVRDIPMVVLVNEFSASASEVLSGALMDHGRGQVVGATTFGKGSVTVPWTLEDGSGVNFTVARWYTPNGNLIEGRGIEPDVLLEPAPAGGAHDTHLTSAIAVLQQQIAQSG